MTQKSKRSKNAMSFDDAVFQLAKEDGVESVLMIPGVWEEASEYYNNEVIDYMESEGLDVNDTELFYEAVVRLAKKEGTDELLGLPGVWEEVSEYYNNAALDRMREGNPMTQPIHVEYNDDLTIRPKTKADEKRIRQALKSFKGKEVGVLVQEDSTIRFLDLAMHDDPILSSAIYGGLGAVVGMIPGAILASPVAMWLGQTAGGALGARAGATENRKGRATWGGGIGGSLGGPVGAALGGALGSRKRDKNPIRQLKNKLLK